MKNMINIELGLNCQSYGFLLKSSEPLLIIIVLWMALAIVSYCSGLAMGSQLYRQWHTKSFGLANG